MERTPEGRGTRVQRGIQARLVVLVLVAALGSMVLLGAGSVPVLSEMREALLRERQALVGILGQQVERGLRDMLEALAAVPPVGSDASEALLAAQRDALRLAQLRSRLISGALVVDAGGNVVAGSDPGEEVRDDLARCGEAREAMRTGTPVVCVASGPSRPRRMYAIVPLRDVRGTTNTAAVGVIDADGAAWRTLLPSLAIGPRVALRLLDASGAPIAGEVRESQSPSDVSVSSRLTVLPWRIELTQPAADLFAPVRSLRLRWMLLLPVLAALAAIFAWGVARSVKRPLAVLEAAAARIADGDLARPVPSLGEDEIGRLGRSFEAMREALARDKVRSRLLRKVISAQEEERKRLARELHDETCQILTALHIKLEEAAHAESNESRLAEIAEAQGMATRSVDELHRIIYDLRPSILDDLGLLPAIRWMAQRNLAPPGIQVRFEFDEPERRLPLDVEIAVFRAVQEAISNVVRHARADKVLIEVAVEKGTLEIDVEDDGEGFDPEEISAPAESGRGLGILGMRERLELVGGTATVTSSPGNGTRVSLRVPLRDEGEHA